MVVHPGFSVHKLCFANPEKAKLCDKLGSISLFIPIPTKDSGARSPKSWHPKLAILPAFTVATAEDRESGVYFSWRLGLEVKSRSWSAYSSDYTTLKNINACRKKELIFLTSHLYHQGLVKFNILQTDQYHDNIACLQ